MDRSGYYDDDCEATNLWRGAVLQTMSSKRGVALLRELYTYLLQLKSKRLSYGFLFDQYGEMCTVGALCASKGITAEDLKDDTSAEAIAEKLNCKATFLREIMYNNDRYGETETNERRYERILKCLDSKTICQTNTKEIKCASIIRDLKNKM